jgi:hypothetical protein
MAPFRVCFSRAHRPLPNPPPPHAMPGFLNRNLPAEQPPTPAWDIKDISGCVTLLLASGAEYEATISAPLRADCVGGGPWRALGAADAVALCCARAAAIARPAISGGVGGSGGPAGSHVDDDDDRARRPCCAIHLYTHPHPPCSL